MSCLKEICRNHDSKLQCSSDIVYVMFLQVPSFCDIYNFIPYQRSLTSYKKKTKSHMDTHFMKTAVKKVKNLGETVKEIRNNRFVLKMINIGTASKSFYLRHLSLFFDLFF